MELEKNLENPWEPVVAACKIHLGKLVRLDLLLRGGVESDSITTFLREVGLPENQSGNGRYGVLEAAKRLLFGLPKERREEVMDAVPALTLLMGRAYTLVKMQTAIDFNNVRTVTHASAIYASNTDTTRRTGSSSH